MDLTRYGAEIAAIVGLFTIAGVLWRMFKRIGETMDVVVKLPPKLDATSAKVDELDKKVDVAAVQHLEMNTQTHTSLVRLETNQGALDVRLRGVEQGVEVLKDRKERGPPRA